MCNNNNDRFDLLAFKVGIKLERGHILTFEASEINSIIVQDFFLVFETSGPEPEPLEPEPEPEPPKNVTTPHPCIYDL